MPKTLADFQAADTERRHVFAVRSRYYNALRSGASKEDAFAYANNPDAAMPEPAVKKVEGPKPPPAEPMAPPQPTMPEPTPKELKERAEFEEQGGDVPPEVVDVDEGDDLTQINGIGPGTQKRLKAKGFTTFSQIAGMTTDEVRKLDSDLNLHGRAEREDWVGQARKLA